MHADDPLPSAPGPAQASREKTYPDQVSAARAVGNHQWLTSLASPLRLPRLLTVAGRTLRFETLDGAHVAPDDLVLVATHLGDVHAAAYRVSLHRADLIEDFTAVLPDGRQHQMSGFLHPRLEAVSRLLTSGGVPAPLFDASELTQRMIVASAGPAAFYKDTNPRNVLVPPTGSDLVPATIDFDDLTLAPFGYDLAKLVVGLVMTYGRLPDTLIARALEAYNRAVRSRERGLPPVTATEFTTWAEVHHILTSRYLGRHGYRHSWHHLRPRALPPACPGPTHRPPERRLPWL